MFLPYVAHVLHVLAILSLAILVLHLQIHAVREGLMAWSNTPIHSYLRCQFSLTEGAVPKLLLAFKAYTVFQSASITHFLPVK